MPELCLTKETRGYDLVGYFPMYHPYVLTSSGCQSVENYAPRGLVILLVYMGWIIVDSKTWIFEIDHE